MSPSSSKLDHDDDDGINNDGHQQVNVNDGLDDGDLTNHEDQNDLTNDMTNHDGVHPLYPLYRYRYSNRYSFKVIQEEDDKADEIKLLDFSRPHGRAFYCGVLVHIVGFLNAYGVSPLLSEIRDTIPKLNQSQLWTSSICNVILNTTLRLPLGTLADKYGPRGIIVCLLCVSAIPTACTGLFVQDGIGLSLARTFSGMSGSIFVVTQLWANTMFTKRVVGVASSVMGSSIEYGFTQLLMGSIVFPIFKNYVFDGNSNLAWRTSMVVPAIVSFVTGITVYYISDDTPKGNYVDRKKNGTMKEANTMAEVPSLQTFRHAACHVNSWILMILYGSIMGSYIALVSAIPLYYKDQFGQSTESSAAISSIPGFISPIGVILGGAISDIVAAGSKWKLGLRGRLIVVLLSCFLSGMTVLLFRKIQTMITSIVVLVFVSTMQNVAYTSIFAVVPYVDKTCIGSVSGIVSFGIGPSSIFYMLAFRQLKSYSTAFGVMGFTTTIISFLTFFIKVNGHSSLLLSSSDNDESYHPHSDDNDNNNNNKSSATILQTTERTNDDSSESESSSSDVCLQVVPKTDVGGVDIESGRVVVVVVNEEEMVLYNVDSDSTVEEEKEEEEEEEEIIFVYDGEESNGTSSSSCDKVRVGGVKIEEEEEEDTVSC